MEIITRKYQICKYCGNPILHLYWKSQDAHIECLHSHAEPVIVKIGENFSAKIYTEVVGSDKVLKRLSRLGSSTKKSSK